MVDERGLCLFTSLQISFMAAVRCCLRCGREDRPEGSLSLTTIAEQGELHEVCQLCCLLSLLGELSTLLGPGERRVLEDWLGALEEYARSEAEKSVRGRKRSRDGA